MKLEMTFDEFSGFLKQFGVNLDRVDKSAMDRNDAKFYLSSPFPKELVSPKTTREKLIEEIPEIAPMLCLERKIEAIRQHREFYHSGLAEAKAAVEKAIEEKT